ncbi:MAG TPA: hypothetical protein VF829_03480 [Candidatus Paceibacterota bacterium]
MTFAKYIQFIIDALNTIVVPVIFTLAFLAFVFGIIKYFFLSTDTTEREKAHAFVLWGTLGMVLLFSVWGLVRLLLVTLGIS